MSMFGWLKQQDTPIVKKSEVKVVEGVLPQCATKYVIAAPCTVKIDYHAWEWCPYVRVSLDEHGWNNTVMFPTNPVTYDYLDSFKSLPIDFRTLPQVRTVIEYKLSEEYTINDKKTGISKTFNGCSLWLFPTGWIYADKNWGHAGKVWALHMTPEIRKDMAERIRVCKQLSEILKNMREREKKEKEKEKAH